MERQSRLRLWLCIVLAAAFVARIAWMDRDVSARRDTVAEAPAGDPKILFVMIDGLRLQDSYKYAESRSPLRPQRNYTPRFTEELLPLGTLYTNAKTGAFNTITTAATNTLVTGAWQAGPNRGRGREATDEHYVDNRSFDRTVFEIARRDLGLPESEVLFISDKLNTRLSDHSYHPLGGKELGPNTHVFRTRFNGVEPYKEETWIDPTDNSDRRVFDTALEALDTLEPDVMFLAFGNVDIAGHRSTADRAADFRFYTRAIEVWDHLIVNLWHEVQRRPAYRDNTTLILCSDHGRHDDHENTSYGNHQGTCDGTRDIVCFVAGPYTPPGAIVERRVYSTAFAPTVASILGIELPEATGQPLYEAIGLVPEVDARRYLRHSRATIEDGRIAVVSKRGNGAGESQIVVQTADRGREFSVPREVVTESWMSPSFHELPAIALENGRTHVAAWHWTETNHEILHWSADRYDPAFSTPRVLARGKTEDSRFGEVSLRAFELLVSGGRSHVIVPAIAQPGSGNESRLTHVESLQFGEGARKSRRDVIGQPRRIGHHRWLDVDTAGDDTLFATFGALALPSDTAIRPLRSTWEIYVKNLTEGDPSTPSTRLTNDNAVADVMPRISIDQARDDRVHVVYASQVDGRFQVHATSSAKTPLAFDPPTILTESSRGAWQPDIIALDGTVHAVWIDFDTGQGDVVYLATRDGAALGEPRILAPSPGISRNPTLLHDPGDEALVVVWEEADADSGFRLEKRRIALD